MKYEIQNRRRKGRPRPGGRLVILADDGRRLGSVQFNRRSTRTAELRIAADWFEERGDAAAAARLRDVLPLDESAPAHWLEDWLALPPL